MSRNRNKMSQSRQIRIEREDMRWNSASGGTVGEHLAKIAEDFDALATMFEKLRDINRGDPDSADRFEVARQRAAEAAHRARSEIGGGHRQPSNH